MKPQVFYPGKILDRYSLGPYQVEMRQLGRLEGQPDIFGVTVTRLYSYVCDTLHHDSIGQAVAAFEEAKRIAIINVGCEAFRLEPVSFARAA